MIYLEDIIELIEDVPDELQRRGGLIQDWERQASEYKRDADKLTARLHNDHSLRDEEKAGIFRQIADLLDRARVVTEKKYEMADKCHQLIQKLSDRVSDWSYHCKLELEVDAPGSTANIENSFIHETMATATAAANIRNQGAAAFRVPVEKPKRDRNGSSSMSRESTPYGGNGGGRAGRDSRERGRTRESSMSSSRASSIAPYDAKPAAGGTALQQLQQQQRKRKRDRERERQQLQYEQALQERAQVLQQQQSAARAAAAPAAAAAAAPVQSSYMRKKKEREREERKLREVSRLRAAAAAGAAAAATPQPYTAYTGYAPVHANRERHSQQRVIKPEPLDDGYEQPLPPPPPERRPPGRPRNDSRRPVNPLQYAAPAAAPQSRRDEMLQLQLERREEQPEDSMLSGGMSDVDDDDLLKFLNDEMPGGIADHDDLTLGLEDENLFISSFGADLGKALEKIQEQRPPSPLGLYGHLNAPAKSSAAGSSRSLTDKGASKAEKKRQQAREAREQQQQQPQFVSFAGGESMHGRMRKVTARAADLTIDMDSRERRRRQKEEDVAHGDYHPHGRGRESRDVSSLADDNGGWAETAGGEDDVDNTPYCYCRQPSDGVMVGCEGRRCKYGGWFHLTCLHMLAPPAVEKWYCVECREARARH